MSDLSFNEKRQFEKLLDMSSGYVLDFTNRTFEEFIKDSSGRSIYDARYDNLSGSKAHRLRMFWQKEDNRTVGKVMSDMLDYIGEPGRQDVEVCRLIVGRLLGKNPARDIVREKAPQEQSQVAQTLAKLKLEFFQLAAETDRNKAGLMFERLLHRLFEAFELRPRQAFRVVGEQIDGSFEMDGQVYLLESKWEKDALSEAPLLVFRSKIESKSTFTRGVFIALNGISAPARDAITRGKAPSFFVMDGYDLMMVLSEAISLPNFLRRRVRLLAEEGHVCVSYSELE